jgi:hypothetical protein
MGDDAVDTLTSAYAFDGPALELGAAVLDGAAHPEARVRVPLSMLNRHGLVAGATGTGKTKTLQLMAEQLSAAGVPCFLADIKGDVSASVRPVRRASARRRALRTPAPTGRRPRSPASHLFARRPRPRASPCRATMTSFGPVLLSKVRGSTRRRSPASTSSSYFGGQGRAAAARPQGPARGPSTSSVSDEGKPELKSLGGLSSATAGVILRELIALESSRRRRLLRRAGVRHRRPHGATEDGRGVVSVMGWPRCRTSRAVLHLPHVAARRPVHDLPEVGDVDKPKLVFFFDEAHLLFDDASEAFLDAIARTVRLIRSKGVGVFFVTQTPKDVPAEVLRQLGNRVQHALRAFTPDDAKALKATVARSRAATSTT